MGHHGHDHQKEEKHHGHHHSHHHQEGSYVPQAPAYGYQQQVGYGVYGSAQPASYGAVQSYSQDDRVESVSHLQAQEHKHKKHEHIAEAVALGAGAFAAYEHHEVKVDPQHGGRHRLEESIAGATAVGAGGYALYEHQQVRHDHLQLQAAGYYLESGRKQEKKHHHGLFH